MSGIQQMLTGGTYKPAGPTTIGQAWGGGFYAGKISTTANGVATHYLIVAPKATGSSTKVFDASGVYLGFNSKIDGPSNTTGEAAAGASFAAATFCENLTIGGYSDWYLPASQELEVLYYFLKPSSYDNVTTAYTSDYAVLPEPISTQYTVSDPAQTPSGINFRTGESECMPENFVWSSTEVNSSTARRIDFTQGGQTGSARSNSFFTRAVRRIPV